MKNEGDLTSKSRTLPLNLSALSGVMARLSNPLAA